MHIQLYECGRYTYLDIRGGVTFFKIKGDLSLFKTQSKFSSMHLAKKINSFFTDEVSFTCGNLVTTFLNFKGNGVSLAIIGAYIICVGEGKDWNLHEFLEL